MHGKFIGHSIHILHSSAHKFARSSVPFIKLALVYYNKMAVDCCTVRSANDGFKLCHHTFFYYVSACRVIIKHKVLLHEERYLFHLTGFLLNDVRGNNKQKHEKDF